MKITLDQPVHSTARLVPVSLVDFADGVANVRLDGTNRVTIDFDRIPKGECEIRHDSDVVTSDHRHVGLVAGLIVDDNQVEGVYVETGLVGFRHLVVLPVMAIGKVRNDQITLNIDRRTFRALSPVEEPAGSAPPKLVLVEHHAAKTAKRLIAAVRGKRGTA